MSQAVREKMLDASKSRTPPSLWQRRCEWTAGSGTDGIGLCSPADHYPKPSVRNSAEGCPFFHLRAGVNSSPPTSQEES